MFCYISKGITQRLRWKLLVGLIFCTTSNIYHYILSNSHITLTKYIPEFSRWITLSIGENRMKIRAVGFEFIESRQTDRQKTRRRILFYNLYWWMCLRQKGVDKIWWFYNILTILVRNALFISTESFYNGIINLHNFSATSPMHRSSDCVATEKPLFCATYVFICLRCYLIVPFVKKIKVVL